MALNYLGISSDLSPNNYAFFQEPDKLLLPTEQRNGRVDVLEPTDPDIRFKMFEKVELRNKASDYRDAITGVSEENVVAQVFFLPQNMQIIQNALKMQVYKMSNSKYILPNQNVNQLKIIMRGIYLQYTVNSGANVTKQVEELNQLVLDYAVPFCYNEAISYEKYVYDQSTLVVPLERSLQPDRQYNQLELKPFY